MAFTVVCYTEAKGQLFISIASKLQYLCMYSERKKNRLSNKNIEHTKMITRLYRTKVEGYVFFSVVR